ncbi:hypothetical protein CSPHI_08415 [Corynebacterium sphenisci DSM 44792]|uniref:Uncharacterized protein n=1 Tax=Corynebacterium sphenisci DSM 44792 TaxID=1437874 RepID=A0A1L7CYZ2_9CORY|nr:hypothetical protein [Corynebacterium sphenisci]APT91050.1 hypothetical protein CSPHI_08415 [Corynebacterium sphenisci DSM 44792]
MTDWNPDHTDPETPTPEVQAAQVVAGLVARLDAGPEAVATALNDLRSAVADYQAAYDAATPLGLTAGRRRPGRLPGARAVAAVARRRREAA